MKTNIKTILEVVGTLLLVTITIVIFRFDDIRGGFFSDSITLESTTGKIINSSMHLHTGVKGTTGYRLNIKYEFLVESKKYTSDKVSFGNNSFRSKQEAQNIVDKYPAGKEVIVYYDKENPNISVLDSKANSNQEFIIVLTLFSLFSLSLIIMMFVQSKKKMKKDKPRKKGKRKG